MPRPSSWLSTTASTLGEELARLGLTVPTDQLEYLLTDRVAAVAEQMCITERTARRYFDHDTLRTLAHDMALSIKEEAPGADLLTLPRTIAMPLPTVGATIAALVEATALAGADTGPGEPATAMALISTLGVLTRDHDGDLPNVWVPEPLLMRAARLIENTADLVHHGCPLPPDVAEDVRPHLQKALRDDAARLRALIPDTGRRSGASSPARRTRPDDRCHHQGIVRRWGIPPIPRK
ncbi:hypothetical protein ACH47B_36555 [Rhodococcus sp. NPDC019627]|uniref:hypothetical protein n=1 Tax=unclassified Rhodococcus (in: high G+C Gram-positive bacteria) TaxID=192944 RepID=UPI0033F2C33F